MEKKLRASLQEQEAELSGYAKQWGYVFKNETRVVGQKRQFKIYSQNLKVYRWIALGNLRRTNGKAFERKARGLITDKEQYKALLHPKTRKTLESATEKVIAAGAQVLDFEMRPMAQGYAQEVLWLNVMAYGASRWVPATSINRGLTSFERERYTDAQLMEIAKDYDYPRQWKVAQPDSYNAALRRGLMDKIKMNMQKNPPQRKGGGTSGYLAQNNYIDIHSGNSFSSILSLDQVKAISKTCLTRSEFWEKSGTAACIAKRLGITDELMAHSPKQLSHGEAIVWRLFTELGIKFIHQWRDENLRDINKLSVDFIVPSFNLAIEVQGDQHFNKNNRFHNDGIVRRDAIKKAALLELGYTFLELVDLKTVAIEEQLLAQLKAIKPRFKFVRTPLTQEQLALITEAGYYTDEKLLEIAGLYKTMKALLESTQHNGKSVWTLLKGRGLLDEAWKKLDRIQRKPYTLDELTKLANQYDELSLFIKEQNNAYNAMHRRDWLHLTKHMSSKNRLALFDSV